MTRTKVRNDLMCMYQAAISKVSGNFAVSEYLTHHLLAGPCYMVAIGKAASSMSLGAVKILGKQIIEGLIITKHGHLVHALSGDPRLLCLEADHPVPGEASLRAGAALIDFIRRSSPLSRFLFLISGGTSSLVEVLPSQMDLIDLRKLNDVLLTGGWSISEMNRVRKAVSLIKGGRLLSHLGTRETTALLISDVPGDDPAVIGSGLLVPDTERAPLPRLPQAVAKFIEGRDPDNHRFDSSRARITINIVATLEDAKQAAARKAKDLGYTVFLHSDFLAGNVENVAASIAESLHQAKPGIHIWGGETTVTLPNEAGRGGRNQHLALALSLQLKAAPGIYVLAAGTDGTDGPTDDAGGLIDAGTISRGESRGIDARKCLQRADAGQFLEASGDLIHTGPTGTNVMDLLIGYKQG